VMMLRVVLVLVRGVWEQMWEQPAWLFPWASADGRCSRNCYRKICPVGWVVKRVRHLSLKRSRVRVLVEPFLFFSVNALNIFNIYPVESLRSPRGLSRWTPGRTENQVLVDSRYFYQFLMDSGWVLRIFLANSWWTPMEYTRTPGGVHQNWWLSVKSSEYIYCCSQVVSPGNEPVSGCLDRFYRLHDSEFNLHPTK
jgi:hypothetical protein